MKSQECCSDFVYFQCTGGIALNNVPPNPFAFFLICCLSLIRLHLFEFPSSCLPKIIQMLIVLVRCLHRTGTCWFGWLLDVGVNALILVVHNCKYIFTLYFIIKYFKLVVHKSWVLGRHANKFCIVVHNIFGPFWHLELLGNT